MKTSKMQKKNLSICKIINYMENKAVVALG